MTSSSSGNPRGADLHAPATPRLSICIATYNRGRFIAETLDSILRQLPDDVELLVVDGASTDDTASVLQQYVQPGRALRYFRENVNSGIDRDYDKAVGYASGEYCWLMTDDDLMQPGAVDRVLACLGQRPDLVVVNARVMTADFSAVLMDRFLAFAEDREYDGGSEQFFAEVARYLTFIGGVVIRRELWLERDRSAFYGTAFVHVGVVFQSPPIGRVKVIAEPLIVIRYGNAMWSPRAFEIWMFKWPRLVWSFGGYPDAAKARVYPRTPSRSLRKLIYFRGIGSYSMAEFRQFLAGQTQGEASWRARLVASTPGWVANAICGLYCITVDREARLSAYDLARSRHSSWVSRLAARTLGVADRAGGARPQELAVRPTRKS